MYNELSTVEYTDAMTNPSRRSAGEKAKMFSNIIKEAMNLPRKVQWKTPSDKEVVSLKRKIVYTFLPATSITSGQNFISSRLVFQIKAVDSKKRRVVVLEWGQVPDRDCGGRFSLVCRLRSTRMVLAIAADYNLGYWQLDYNTATLNAGVEEGG